MITQESLKQRALAATSGPWRLEKSTNELDSEYPHQVIQSALNGEIKGSRDGEDGHQYIASASGFGDQMSENARYIASANPATVLKLIEHKEALEEALTSYANIDYHGETQLAQAALAAHGPEAPL